MLNNYRVFGQNVESEILLPELIRIERPKDIDVEIIISKNYIDISDNKRTVHIKNTTYPWSFCYFSQNHMAFEVKSFVIEVTDGKKISVYLPKEYEVDALRTYILGTAFGALLMQKGYIPLHAATIERNNKAVLLTGFSNAGKSTYLEHFIKQGYRFSADDVSVLWMEKDEPIILPAYPQRKTARSILDELSADVSTYTLISESDKEKYLVRDQSSWCSSNLSVEAIIEIVPVNKGKEDDFKPYIRKLEGIEALAAVQRQLYRRLFYGNCNEFTAVKMKMLVSMLKQVSVYGLFRPDNTECIDDCVELIKDVLSK